MTIIKKIIIILLVLGICVLAITPNTPEYLGLSVMFFMMLGGLVVNGYPIGILIFCGILALALLGILQIWAPKINWRLKILIIVIICGGLVISLRLSWLALTQKQKTDFTCKYFLPCPN